MAYGSPTRRACPNPPLMGPIFAGGDGSYRSSGEQIWQSIWNEYKIIAWSYLLPVTPAGMKGSNEGPPLLSVVGQLPGDTPGVV